MMPSQPLVSICVPAYNNGRFIAATLESILAQTYPNFEVVISDDSSPDDTVAVMKRFNDPRIKLQVNPANLGMVGNFDNVLARASGKYAKVLCGDDVLYPDCLRRQVEALEDPANAGVVLAVCESDVINPHGEVVLRRRSHFKPGRIKGTRLMRASVRGGTNFIGEPGSGLFRRDAEGQPIALDSSNPYLVDMDLWAKLLVRGDAFIDKTPLAGFRISDASATGRLGFKQASCFRQFARKIHDDPAYELNRLDLFSGYFLSFHWCILRNMFFGFRARRHMGT